ncbi:MAG: 4-hydroxybenzoate octaprenyltransferase [Thiohalobacteraceae bacterium]
MKQRLYQYYLLTRLHKPIGALLLLWPTLWALWLAAEGMPSLPILLVFVLGVVLMRSAGCVINDYADRSFDPQVRRTRDRPLATGRVSPREALLVFALLCLVAFMLVLTLNRLTIYLAFGGLMLAAAYPFTKRYTQLPQLVLGAAFGWAIPMAFAAVQGGLPKLAWLLFTVNVLWATAYDTFYAMVDREDDLRVGVKSTAILFGEADLLVIGVLQILALAGLVLVGGMAELGLFYYLGLLVAAGFALYQQYLARQRDPAGSFQAFLNNNWFGAAVFVGIALHYLAANS